MSRKTKDLIIKSILLFCALSSLVFLGGIVLVLITQGIPIVQTVGIGEFLFGTHWYPTHDDAEFGILPMIYGSLIITAGALLFAAPLSILSALFLAEIAPFWLRETIKPVIELLAGIPSVIYGLFGAIFIAPIVQKVFNIPTGLTAFSAALILGIMVLPTVTSIVEDALTSIPKEYREAALAVGATKWETMTKITLPAAASGISTALILGIGRAIGETMAVLMVAGGSPRIVLSLLKPARAMTSTIAAEMAETVMGSNHYYALFGIAIVLFIMTLGFNLIADHISHRFHRKFTALK